jgi:hypothetical protein
MIMALNFGKPLLPLALSFFLLVTPWAASSGGADEKGIDAQALIDACWAISLEDRSSGVTGRMRHGAAKTVRCLEDVILDQVEILFPDGEYLSREQAKQKLDALAEAVQTMYWSIYNENIACDPSCGTYWHDLHLHGNAHILEHMLREIVRVRNMYGL